MCGIVGFITAEKARGVSQRRKFFEAALIADAVRGVDSTGYFSVAQKSSVGESADWLKIASDPHALLATKQYKEKMGTYQDWLDVRCVIGHNRSATVGTVDNDNAHPFQEGPITLVHNGTLTTTSGLKHSMHDLKGKDVEVDSHVICHNLAVADDPADVISKLDGAFVLVWHDARTDTINIVRNDKRPLHMMWAKCEETVLLASEGEMLHWLASRSDFQLGPIVYAKPGQLITFSKGSTIPDVRELPLYVPTYHYGSYSDGWHGSSTRGARRFGRTPQRTAPWIGVLERKIPLVHRKKLDDMGISADSLAQFIPALVSEIPGSPFGIVSGNLFDEKGVSRPALVTGLSKQAVDNCVRNKERWTVRPIGVRVVERDKEKVALVQCALWSRAYAHDEVTRVARERGRVPAGIERLGGRSAREYLPGPDDVYIPADAWLAYTSNGCVQCGMPLYADDAEKIIWTDGDKPLCEDCNLDNHKAMACYD